MINPGEWTWVVDINEMICKNAKNKVTVKIQKNGKILKGTLGDMPIDLFAEIAGYKNGEKIIEKIVMAAEKEYLRVMDEGA